ncbi:hypothetical protein GALL_412100 [mine drainage metagenome]|uniref:Uncharacterized protein n=1 Tax=mine drainage metagenome TaxID=410659 RepID=A0A1J5Q194_9ZZZZ
MWIPDMPNVPPQNVPVMIAQANQAQAIGATGIRTLGVCAPVSSNINSADDNVISPLKSAQDYFGLFENRTVTGPATTTIVQQPAHGVLRLVTEADRGTLFSSDADLNPADPGYVYLPDSNYVGKDSGTVQVDFGNGLKVNVKYYFQAIDHPLGNTGFQNACKKTGLYWKISSTLAPNGTSTITSVDYLPSLATAATPVTNTITLDSILGTSLASSLDANTSGVTLNIANLPNAAVGQTTGTAITLDTNAAGYGWFVDTTPVPFY